MEKRDRKVHQVKDKTYYHSINDELQPAWLHGRELQPGDVLRSVNHKYKLIVLETKSCKMFENGRRRGIFDSTRKQKCTECDKITFKGLVMTPNTHDDYRVNVFEESWYCPTKFKRFKVDNNENAKKTQVRS